MLGDAWDGMTMNDNEPVAVDAPITDQRGRRRGRLLAVVLVVVAVAVAVGLAGGLLLMQDERAPVTTNSVIGGMGVSEISAADLETVARTRVFFGHQSVGMNILDGVPAVFGAHSLQAPP